MSLFFWPLGSVDHSLSYIQRLVRGIQSGLHKYKKFPYWVKLLDPADKPRDVGNFTVNCQQTRGIVIKMAHHSSLRTPEKTIFMVLLCLSGFMLLNSCAVGPNYKRPVFDGPNRYQKNAVKTTTSAHQTSLGQAQHFNPQQNITATWWTVFRSKPLNDLMTQSLKHNPTKEAAEAALHAALENVYAQQGAFFPFVGASFNPSVQQTAKILTSVLSSNQYNYSLYTGQVYVSYTPDIFGWNRRQVESLTALANLQRYQLEATYMTLTTNIVNAVIQEASLRAQISTTKKIISDQQKILRLLHQAQKIGDISSADIALQEASLATAEATLPPLEKQLEMQRDLLNALTGRFPDDKKTPTFTLNSLQLPTELPLSLPSRLLEQRPDIRAAEEQMHAANALIGVAIANRLPNISIGFTNAGFAGVNLSTLFVPHARFWSLAGLIAQPIFAGGTLLHRQRYAEVIYQQTAAQYRLTVINAFQNLADTLKAIQWDAKALKATHKAEQAALKSLSISRQQLTLGDTTTLAVILNEQQVQQARLARIQSQTNRLTDAVALFQALGGGWTNSGQCI